ncbi:MAG: hypothetical protein ND807_01710 [Vicinamibacterales bacterium]|nr:hypothetical protein [Vicinamibacterales bacterium]
MPTSPVLRVALFTALAVFYVAAASEHARTVNTFKARGDQSGYLWDAQNMYSNWHGANPPILIGERNRMPLYAAFLAAFWSPEMSNDDFFTRAKTWNIYLSVALLAVLAIVFARCLPPLPATNLTLVVAFGYFIFKAGYTQSELLFYTLFFLAFLAFWDILTRRGTLRGTLVRAVAAGALAALAHLTKAALLPLVAIFICVCTVDVLRGVRIDPRASMMKLVTVLMAGLAFLLVLSPYIRENKRAFGHYFYNVNTTFYMWYDDWPQASVGTIKHGDGVGWPTMPAEDLPSPSRYWREHTVRQIAARVGGGTWDMLDRSYKTYWYFKYLALYLACALWLAIGRRAELRDMIGRHRAAALFLALYAATYGLGIAFYAPVSGTGTTRFLIAHLTPLFFVLSVFLTTRAVEDSAWRVAGTRVTLQHFHLLVLASLGFDIAFVIWPRLMTTYGGF